MVMKCLDMSKYISIQMRENSQTHVLNNHQKTNKVDNNQKSLYLQFV